ncbi:FecCD family ABC transporter permease [Limoniibacter endophyticus]|uniref:Heme ABC transporter permease n=1 Tax=Limoniibacter endophyticus TaxID=1565040 RepID=A0A8J3DIT1_9HYPH|nr:iron ABC transporter permease [Limoniibacter endophyticus]GHC75745.1 heme ABC transporter permease [Limoniibacter endophyticus]
MSPSSPAASLSTGSFAGDRQTRAQVTLAALILLLIAACFVSLATGASGVSAGNVIWSWLAGSGEVSARDTLIMRDIRLPRTILGVLVGGSLATSGAIMQGLFRNPLADPGLVGVSAGAGLFAIIIIVLGGGALAPFLLPFGIYALPLGAFFGGFLVTFLLYRIATRQGRTEIATMLLAGIALSALAGAVSGVMIFYANDQQLRDLTFWGLGSLAGTSWIKIAAAGPIIALCLATAPLLSGGLNALALGEAGAAHLGISVQQLKWGAITNVAAAVGACVAVTGGIGFVGIVVPHLLRLVIGPDNRYLLPCSALLGASLLLLADALARVIVSPAELPIGIVTALFGAPFFLWLLLRNRQFS